MAVLGGVAVWVSDAAKKLLATVLLYISGCPKHYFPHQQSYSVALSNLLFGHNYRGFLGAIEWEPSEWKKLGVRWAKTPE